MQVLSLFVLSSAFVTTAFAATSVNGTELKTCSQVGTAITGYTRDGYCQNLLDDRGAHHICIRMKPDFCHMTGQPNWCAQQMQCMGQPGVCPIGNWCVCQWAFARYIKMAGGCDSIVDVVCDATNIAALQAYRRSSHDAHIREALECLEKRCGLISLVDPRQLDSQQTHAKVSHDNVATNRTRPFTESTRTEPSMANTSVPNLQQLDTQHLNNTVASQPLGVANQRRVGAESSRTVPPPANSTVNVTCAVNQVFVAPGADESKFGSCTPQ